jgi:hypothetical protein
MMTPDEDKPIVLQKFDESPQKNIRKSSSLDPDIDSLFKQIDQQIIENTKKDANPKGRLSLCKPPSRPKTRGNPPENPQADTGLKKNAGSIFEMYRKSIDAKESGRISKSREESKRSHR